MNEMMYVFLQCEIHFLQPFLPARIAISRDLLQSYNYDEKGHTIYFMIS
jgi:hypothetical protein